MKDNKWMIYGANGYTGRLVVDEALRRGLKPVLAGRDEQVQVLADEKGLEANIFALDELENIIEKLSDFSVVANCAGPFSSTANKMI